MYNWYVRIKDQQSENLVNPDEIENGKRLNSDGSLTNTEGLAVSGFIEVSGVAGEEYFGQVPQINTPAGQVTGTNFHIVVSYDQNKNVINSSTDESSFFTGGKYVRLGFYSDKYYPNDIVYLTKGFFENVDPFFKERQVYPVYEDLSRNFKKEKDYIFLKEQLDGKVKFIQDDFDFFYEMGIEEKIVMSIRDKEGFFEEIRGFFYKTDAEWDSDSRSLQTAITIDDKYETILNKIDSEYNVIEEAVGMESIYYKKRMLIQVYNSGDNYITNIYGGMHFTQELDIHPVTVHDVLVDDYHFNRSKRINYIADSYSSELSADITGSYNSDGINAYVHENGLYRIKLIGQYQGDFQFVLYRVSDDQHMYITGLGIPAYEVDALKLEFRGINGNSGRFKFTNYEIYTRIITNKNEMDQVETYDIPENDIVLNNSNYKKCIGYQVDTFQVYEGVSVSPTKFGKYPDDTKNEGKYYKEFQVSEASGISTPIPVGSKDWGALSLWFFNNPAIRAREYTQSEDVLLRDAYPLHEIIKTLLERMGSSLIFDNTEDHSQFLYSETNPLGTFTFLEFEGNGYTEGYSGNLNYYLTPKSNVIKSNYDNSATKAKLTIGGVFDILYKAFKCRWHIEGNSLIIEHVSYYQNGKTYSQQGVIGTDLTGSYQYRNRKVWNFNQNKWSFDKEEMPETLKYGWADDVSPNFEGNDIKVDSNFVQEGKEDSMESSLVTSDIDFIMTNTDLISKDGFCIFGTAEHNGKQKVPFVEVKKNPNYVYILQNGFLTTPFLQEKYHFFDLPSDKIIIDGENKTLYENITRKKKQEINMPAKKDSDFMELVKTGIGIGAFEKVEINMSSYFMKATIGHDTNNV